jgi:hypothetical protein
MDKYGCVPDARSAESRSIRGPSAAMTRSSTGGGAGAASSASRYSTIAEKGFSYMPSRMRSIGARWLMPTPSRNRCP